MKKTLLLITCLICLSGCTANYNVVFSNDIIETLTIPSSTYNINALPAYIDEIGSSETDEKLEGVSYYDVSDVNGYRKYSYKFGFDDYSKSNIANINFKSVKLSELNGEYILNTSKTMSYFKLYSNLENVNVSMVFDKKYYEITSSNADITNNNVLIWNFDRNNYQEKYIQVRFKKVASTNGEDDKKVVLKKESWIKKHANFIILVTFSFFLIIIMFTILLKVKKCNKSDRF